MFKIKHDNEGEITDIILAVENEIVSENELIVNELPLVKQFYQRMKVENEKLIVVDNELTEEQIKMYKQFEKQQEINELKNKLDNDWSWRWERNSAENIEIQLDLRKYTTEDKAELILERKSIVDKINELEKEGESYGN